MCHQKFTVRALLILLLWFTACPLQAQSLWPQTNLSALFLFEVIGSNTNQSSGRFNNPNTFFVLCQPRTNLALDSQISDHWHGHLGLAFAGTCGYGAQNDENSFRIFKRPIDEMFITYQHNERFHAKIGVMYLPFGDYERNHIPATFTQLLTQSQQLALVTRYKISKASSLSTYAFKNPLGTHNHINNAGVRFHSILISDEAQRHTELFVDWLYNMPAAVNYVKHKRPTPFEKKSAGIALTIKQRYHKLNATLQYATALSTFDVEQGNPQHRKPSAWTADLAYHHHIFQKSATTGVSGQFSQQSIHVGQGGLPRARVHIYSMLEFAPKLWTGAHIIADRDYSSADGGTGRTSLTGIITAKLFID